MTPLEKMLQDMGSIREDGSDKFFAMENVSLRLKHLALRIFADRLLSSSSEIHGELFAPGCRSTCLK